MVLVLLVAMSACGKPTSGPLLQTVPQLDDVPTFQPLAMREVPAPVRDQLTLVLKPGDITPSSEEYVNSPGAQATEPGTRPSVIISVPLEATRAARQAAELRAQGLVPSAVTAQENVAGTALESFQTDGYYNEAEQQIETALIRRGFDVLDRARFEATLRDLRDRADSNGQCYGDICDIAEAAGTSVARARLEEALKNGDIELSEYQQTLEELNRRAERSSPGQRRTEDEMVDIAEVIRAAQSGTETADYLLQISLVQVEPSFDRQFNIDAFPETQAFLDRHPGLQLGSGPGQLPSAIPARWYRAEFNAKLMSIRTGSIVWLGNHELSSQHAEPLTITMDVERSVANGEAVQAAIRAYNLRGDKLQDAALRTRKELQDLYQTAQSPRQFESEQAMTRYQQDTRSRIAQLQREFRDLQDQLAAHAASRPAEFTQDFHYAYSVSEPRVTPNLADFDVDDRRAQELLDQHRNNLIRAVTRSLIETIQVIG
jgi:hypothetical protein